MNEIDIQEVGGIVVDPSNNKRIVISERGSSLLIDLVSGYSSMQISPANAHRLARHLHRLATRVENRIDASVALAKEGE